jgi:hypothetical protein
MRALLANQRAGASRSLPVFIGGDLRSRSYEKAAARKVDAEHGCPRMGRKCDNRHERGRECTRV